jgi:hypothetical protein
MLDFDIGLARNRTKDPEASLCRAGRADAFNLNDFKKIPGHSDSDFEFKKQESTYSL